MLQNITMVWKVKNGSSYEGIIESDEAVFDIEFEAHFEEPYKENKERDTTR